MARTLLIAFLLTAVLAPAASAGDADSTSPPPSSLVRVLDRIQPASMVRVEARTLGILEGTFERFDVHALLLREQATEKAIPLSLVEGLWVRGRATAHGAKVGAIALGIAGAIVGPVTVGLDRIREGGSQVAPQAGDYLEAAAIGAGVGVGIGALVGAGIGAVSHRWNRRFP